MSLYLGTNLISGVATPIEGARNIGQIVQSTIPLSDAGLHLLDGSLISGSGSYADFVTYISNLDLSASYFCTEAEWQDSVTNYGVCGKFVYDSVNNTVRLPKITGFTEGTIDPTLLGNLTEAGLPNITGTMTSSAWKLGRPALTGAFYKKDTGGDRPSYGTSGGSDWYFDASRSNPIYGNSNTVQPQAIKVFYYIVIATSAKTNIEVDIDQIATDLNGKADTNLINVPSSKGILQESYVNGTSWYRVYSDGWCEQGGVTSSAQTSTVTFLKAFSNTNYNIAATSIHSKLEDGYSAYAYKTSATQVTLYNKMYGKSVSAPISWQACGYIR